MKRALKVIGIVIAVPVLIAGIWFGGIEIRKATADYRGEAQQIEQVEANADFRIQAYDHFFDLCAAIQTHEQRIANLEEELEGASESRAAQTKTNITASKNQRAELINQYNADAAKDWTQGQFQANSLPFRINMNQESTTCA